MINANVSRKMRTTVRRRPCESGPEIPQSKTCCELSCLAQPRFFCGQLLTDTDLTALLTWSQDKFRLGRYKQGWGVTCGLRVTVDPDNPRGVIIHPGLAVDCCGEDVLVCQETPYDLSSYCPASGCLEIDLNKQGAQTPAGQEYLIYDLYLRYAEEGSLPQTPLGRGACGQPGACEFSRVHETFRPELREVTSDQDEAEAVHQEWESRYATFTTELNRVGNELMELAAGIKAPGDTASINARARLKRWMEKESPGQFGFVRPMFEATESAGISGEEVSKILYWLTVDRRAAYLKCGCPACEVDAGVRVARLWMRLPDDETPCHIFAVEDTPVYRREFAPQVCYPTTPYCVNLMSYVGQRPQDVEFALHRAGIPVGSQYVMQTNWDELKVLLKSEKVRACNDEPVKMVMVNYLVGGARVVGFMPEGK